MNRHLLLTAVLALAAASAASAQQQRQPREPSIADTVRREQEVNLHQWQTLRQDSARSDHQAWLESMANLARLRAGLAEAWQAMGMSPQGARLVADAYDPHQAGRLHHAALRGKSDQEVAQMMQLAIKEKRYLHADQLLIDYQREKLNLGETASLGAGR